MAINTTTTSTTTTNTTNTTTVTNPNSVLGKDDFLKLLLAELEHQDPTSPTDSEKILEQTSQLATLEAQQSTNELMKELTASFKTNQNFDAVNAIGKKAKLSNELTVKAGEKSDFDLYFDQEIKSGTISITDEQGNLVESIKLEPDTSGTHTYTFDASDIKEDGKYTIKADYITPDNKALTSEFGTYKISSVKFEDNKAYLKLGNSYISFDSVKEIFE